MPGYDFREGDAGADDATVQIWTNGDMSGNLTSAVITMNNRTQLGLQFQSAIATRQGLIEIDGRVSTDADFENISFVNEVGALVTSVVVTGGVLLRAVVDLGPVHYVEMRARWIRTLGIGVLNGWVNLR